MKYAVAFMIFSLGMLAGSVITIYEYGLANTQRTYDAYRACIQTSQCLMTAQDYIDYYNLKWQLEEEQ